MNFPKSTSLFIITLILFSVLLIAAHPAAKRTGGRPPLGKTYTFGDDMLDFVHDSVFIISDAFIRQDYPARSLNGFQVTLDKSRDGVNEAINAINHSSAILDSLKRGAELIFQFESDPSGFLTQTRIARLAGYTSAVNTTLNELAFHKEKVLALQKTLVHLDTPITYDQFKEEQLDAVPLLFVLSSMRGKPDFNQTVSFTITVSNDGGSTSEANATEMGMSLLGLLGLDQDHKEYLEQTKRYNRAIKEIPDRVPGPDTCYQIYKRGFLWAKALYGEEPGMLSRHMDSISNEITSRYKTLSDLKAIIENGLLSDRVRASFNALSLNSYSPSAQTAIKNRLLQIRAARMKVMELREGIEPGSKKAGAFISLEDIGETCTEVEKFIEATDSLLLFRPITNLLPAQLQWFQKQREWASAYLQQGYDSDSSHFKIVNPEKNQNKQASGNKSGKYAKTNLSSIWGLPFQKMTDDPFLSISATWPTGYGQPIHGFYPRSGLEVWFRSSDGGFASDSRNGGNIYAGWISNDLRSRIKDVRENYSNALTQAKASVVSRQQEIRRQASLTQRYAQQTRQVREIIPGSYNPVAHPASPPLAYQELDPKYTTAHTDYSVQIKSELQRQAAALSGLTPEQLSSAAVLRYRELHGKYLDYAYGLWAGGFLKEAARMLYGAQGLRAQFEGFPVSDLQSPLFEKPDIPFTPLTKDYYNTVSKRSAEYLLMNDKVRSKSRWFEAAAIVTRVNGLGMLDAIDFTHGYGFSATADFLRETNEALFTINMLNAIKIDAGTLDETFTTPKGEVISFKNLSGKELDYALVKFEQTKVEEFLIKYLKAHSFLDAGLNAATINLFMRAPWLPDEVKRALFESFNFARYEDRVRLGQRIIDELYKKP